MKRKIEEIVKKAITDLDKKKISRKAAIRKTGYIALSAATMMMLISSPEKAQAASPAAAPPW